MPVSLPRQAEALGGCGPQTGRLGLALIPLAESAHSSRWTPAACSLSPPASRSARTSQDAEQLLGLPVLGGLRGPAGRGPGLLLLLVSEAGLGGSGAFAVASPSASAGSPRPCVWASWEAAGGGAACSLPLVGLVPTQPRGVAPTGARHVPGRGACRVQTRSCRPPRWVPWRLIQVGCTQSRECVVSVKVTLFSCSRHTTAGLWQSL